MKKPAAALGVAVAAISLSVGLVACGKDSKESSTTTSTSTSTSTSTTTTTATSAQASGANETIADYIAKNNIQETPITHGTPGAPTVDLPVPEGWTLMPEDPNTAPYGGIKFNTPSNPADPPQIIAIFEKLTGNVNTDEILAAAPGELKNLPGYDGGDGQKGELSGYPAYEIGGSYTRNGAQRLIAQKTVIIEAPDATYILQLNAEGPEADGNALMDATGVIDDQTKITV